MLTVSEELLLLLLDDESGRRAGVTPKMLAFAFSGAALMDLSLENRIATDSDHLKLIDATPLDDDLLDPILADIASEEGTRSTGYWLDRMAHRGDWIRKLAHKRLVDQGILESGRRLAGETGAVSDKSACPHLEGSPANEDVQLRLFRVLLTDEMPSSRDTATISLATVCGVLDGTLAASRQRRLPSGSRPSPTSAILKSLISRADPRSLRKRMQLVARMNFIGRAVKSAIGVSNKKLPPVSAVPGQTRGRKIPRAPGLPIVGNAISLSGDFLAFLVRQHLRLGPVFQVRAFHRKMTVLAGIEANQFVTQYGKNLLRSQEFWRRFDRELGAGRSIISMDGSEHVRSRRAQRAGYSRQAAEQCMDEVLAIVRRRIKEWPLDRPLPAWQAIAPIVTEQLGVVAASMSPRKYLNELHLYVQSLLMSRVIGSRPGWVMKLPKVRRARKRIDDLFLNVLSSHQPWKRRSKRRDLIDDLLDLHESDPQFLPETDLRVSLLGPFVAGLDTVSGVCQFMLYALFKNPEVLDRMRAESDELFAGGDPTPEDVRRLDVTPRVVKETMRMYPVAPVMIRDVINSFEFAGYRIPAGDTVLVATTVPHFLPEIFPDPDVFDIDRYAPGRNEHRQQGAFNPFGIGPHRCLGAMFAEWQVAVTMAAIVHHTSLEMHPENYSLKIRSKPNPAPDSRFGFRLIEMRDASNRNTASGTISASEFFGG